MDFPVPFKDWPKQDTCTPIHDMEGETKKQNIDRLDSSSPTIPLGTNSEEKMELITRKLLIFLFIKCI